MKLQRQNRAKKNTKIFSDEKTNMEKIRRLLMFDERLSRRKFSPIRYKQYLTIKNIEQYLDTYL